MQRWMFGALLLFAATSAFTADAKRFDATYTATIGGTPPATRQLKVCIPLPVSRSAQDVTDLVIDSPYAFAQFEVKEFGNRYAFATIADPPAGDLVVRVRFRATRREVRGDEPYPK